jgi:hypothetical protein
MPLRFIGAPLAGSALLLAVGTFPAFAIEPEAAAAAIGAALTKGSKADFAYESATQNGDDIVIKGFTLTRASSSESVRFDEAVIESPTGDGPGFSSPRITFNNGTATGEATGSIGSATVTEVTLLDPAEVKGEGFAAGILYKTAEIGNVQMTRESEPGEITIDRVSVQSGNVVDNVPQDNSGIVEGLSVSPEIFASGRFKPADLGYDKLVFDLTWDGTHNIAEGALTIRDFTFKFREGGDLSITGTVGKLPDPRVLDDADVMAKTSDVELHTLTIRYADNSFAGRVLDLLAKEQEMSRDDYVKQITAALPFLLAALENSGFRDQLTGALAAFLQQPQSLTVKLQPESPVSAEEIGQIASSAPGTLPERLKATVTANSPN